MALLHQAVTDNSIQQVQILIEKGVDVNQPKFDGSDPHVRGTPLHAAAYKGYEEIAELLISNGASLEAKNHKDQTALQVAAFWNNSNIVKLLLSRGANVDARDMLKRTPLHLATQQGNCGIIQLLLDYNADINAFKGHGKTPLQIAIIQNDLKATKILLKNGANPNLAPTNQLGFRLIPIHFGISLKNFDIVKLLIAYNADLNLKDHRGFTPMHWAIHRRNLKTMKVLLMHGASVDIQDMNGNNAFEKALNMDLDHVAKMIWFDQM